MQDGRMLTPVKFLFLALLAAAVWYGWRFWRWQRRFREEFQRQMDEAARSMHPAQTEPPPVPDTEIDDLAACPVCETYGVPGRMKSCGRPDCPYPG
jgi:hypothetical protein